MTAPGIEIALHPAPAPQRTKGLLIGSLAAVAAVSVAVGGFLVTRGSSDDVIVDDSIEVVTEREPSTEAYSFAAAATNVQLAQSVSLDLSVDTPEGPMTMSAAIDRGTGRMSFEMDMSELIGSDMGFGMGDSMKMIMDEPGGVGYIDAGIYAGFLDVSTDWVSMDIAEFGADSFEELFAAPLDTTAVFGGIEPVDLGLETINGETLHRFQVTLTEEIIADAVASGDLPEGLDDLGGLETVTYDVWVSEDSQIRRMLFNSGSAGESIDVDMWITISPEPVDIALPDPADVTSLNDLFNNWSDDMDIEIDSLEDELSTTED